MDFTFSNEKNLPVKNRLKAGQKFTGLLYKKYTNGNMKLFAEVKNGLLEGEFMTGHKNGQVASHGICDEDFRVGLYEEFRENGTLSQTMSYPLAREDFVIGIPYLTKTYFDDNQQVTNQITYTKPCWEK